MLKSLKPFTTRSGKRASEDVQTSGFNKSSRIRCSSSDLQKLRTLSDEEHSFKLTDDEIEEFDGIEIFGEGFNINSAELFF